MAFVVLLTADIAAAEAPLPLSRSTHDGEPEPRAKLGDAKAIVGVRVGYGYPIGQAQRGLDLDSAFSGVLPISVDVGRRVNESFVLGGYWQYATGFVNADGVDGRHDSQATTSGYVVRFGLDGTFDFLPDFVVAPWLGLGVGYEIAGIGTVSRGGFELLNVQAGFEWKPSTVLAVGPFVSCSVGQYSLESVAERGQSSSSADISGRRLHAWLEVGIKASWTVGLVPSTQ
jgi:hypothetical protein